MTEPVLWRLKAKPGNNPTPELRRSLISAMLDGNFVCTGWNLEEIPDSEESYVTNLAREFPDGKWKASARFATGVRRGHLVWIVDLDGKYHLARVAGEWYYQEEDQDYGVHAVNRYKCEWIARDCLSPDVPSGVRNAFLVGSAFQQIADQASVRFSMRLAGIERPFSQRDFIDLIDHEALEDLVGIYLQKFLDGYLTPSSAKRSNIAYEFVIQPWSGARRAIVQVKSGQRNIVDALANIDADRFLFALNGQYPNELHGAKVIDKEKLINFALSNVSLLPATIQNWIAASTS